MFKTLLESRTMRERNLGSQLISVALHAGVIAVTVAATHRVVEANAPVAAETVVFVSHDTPPAPPAAPPPHAVAAPPAPKGFQIVVAAVDIPNVLPQIDLTRAVTNAADFTGRSGVAGGTADGVVGSTPRLVDAGTTYRSYEVDKVAALLAGSVTPEYPDLLKRAGVEGTVRVSFVINVDGRAEPGTLTIVGASHALFADAVRKALPGMRFLPAEFAGRKVRQLVEMPFAFTIK